MKPLKEIAAFFTRQGKILETGIGGFAAEYGPLRIVISNGGGWDHVSVSHRTRVPRYEEMRQIKMICFKPSEVAIEYHVPPSRHVNTHPNCLHLWRPQDQEIPTPPLYMV